MTRPATNGKMGGSGMMHAQAEDFDILAMLMKLIPQAVAEYELGHVYDPN